MKWIDYYYSLMSYIDFDDIIEFERDDYYYDSD